MVCNIEIIRSERKSIAVHIKSDLRVIVRAPLRMKQTDIDRFIAEKTPLIEKHLAIMQARRASAPAVQPLTAEELRALTQQAAAVIPPEVEVLAQKIGVTYGKITIRHQRTLWGSCSESGNLNFNCLLMLCPDAVVEYIIIHELCHRKHMNHSKAFWAMVKRFCPQYAEQRRWLKENGNHLIKRLKAGGEQQ